MSKYKCGQCKKRVEFNAQNIGIRCPYCGNKYFYKERPTVAKTLTAESISASSTFGTTATEATHASR